MGASFTCYVHASQQRGIFRFEHLPARIVPALMMRNYSGHTNATNDNSHAGEGLQKLIFNRNAEPKTAKRYCTTNPRHRGNIAIRN